MKNVKHYLTQHFKPMLSIMSIFVLCFLFASTRMSTWVGNGKSIEMGGGIAFIGLVVNLKKKSDGEEKSAWDIMDAGSRKFAEGMDVVLSELAKNKVEQKSIDDALAAFEEKHKGTILNAEQKKAVEETTESVRKMAVEIQKMKDAGFEAHDVLPFEQAFVKALKEKKDEMPKIVGNKTGYVTLSFKAAAAMSLGNISANTSTTVPGTTVMPGLASAPRNTPFIIDLIDVGTTSTPTIQWFNKVNREDGTAFIAEGIIKPLSDFDIVGETATVKKVATRFNVSEEALSDIPFLEGEIRTEGVDSLRLAIDDQILAGDNTGANLKGILEYVGGYSLPAIDDSTENANEYDAILAAHTMLNTLNYIPNAILVHPTDRFKLRTIKDSNGNYIIPPSADSSALNIDGLPVIAKNQITAGNMLMGDFKKSHARFLMDINVRVGYDGEDFSHNRVTFLVEARLVHFIKDVETSAFVYDSFAVIKGLLESGMGGA